MFWIWAWGGLVLFVIVLFVVYHFVRANVQRLKKLDQELQAEHKRFEAHRAKELWDLEHTKNHPIGDDGYDD